LPRRSKLWFREEDRKYDTTISRKQIPLSRDRKVAEVFLGQSEINNTPKTFAVPRRYLPSFCDCVEGRRVPDLRFADVTAWIKANPSWGQSTISLAVRHSP
jgi:hypothetical protein